MPDDESSVKSAIQDPKHELTATVGPEKADKLSSDVENDTSPASQLAIPASTAKHDPLPQEDYRPPLPPRPTNIALLHDHRVPQNPSFKIGQPPRPQLQSTATTAISRTDINTHAYQDGSRETFAATVETTPPQKSSPAFGSIRRMKGLANSEGGDNASIRSFVPTLNRGGDNESILGDLLGPSQDLPAWKLFGDKSDDLEHLENRVNEEKDHDEDFDCEFDSIKEVDADGGDEGNHGRGQFPSRTEYS